METHLWLIRRINVKNFQEMTKCSKKRNIFSMKALTFMQVFRMSFKSTQSGISFTNLSGAECMKLINNNT